MAKFKNDKGLTLIELLITIAVLAVVSAIALPVINNVVSSSNSNAAVQTQNDVTDFITKYNAAGETLYASGVLSGYVDTDGDNTIDSNELVDTLTIDPKFTATLTPTSTSDNVGGNYTNDGVFGVQVTLAAGGTSTGTGTGSANYTGFTYVTGLSGYHFTGTAQSLNFQSYSASTRVIQASSQSFGGPCLTNVSLYDSTGASKGYASVSASFDGMYCNYTIDLPAIEAATASTITSADVIVLHNGSWYPLAPFSLASN